MRLYYQELIRHDHRFGAGQAFCNSGFISHGREYWDGTVTFLIVIWVCIVQLNATIYKPNNLKKSSDKFITLMTERKRMKINLLFV
jgi:hypothetical protein